MAARLAGSQGISRRKEVREGFYQKQRNMSAMNQGGADSDPWVKSA
jgi:hypothetical protein